MTKTAQGWDAIYWITHVEYILIFHSLKEVKILCQNLITITTLQDSKYVLKQIVSKNNKSRLRVFEPTSSFQVVLLCIKV